MATLIGSICRAAIRSTDAKLNILTFPTHERYEEGLARTGHNFYAWRGAGIKDWKDTYAPRPANYFLLKDSIPIDLDLDFILCQNKFAQYPVAAKLSSELHLPLVCLEHTLPMPEWYNQLEQFRAMCGHLNVFISEYSRDQWGWDEKNSIVIHHGVDTNTFSPGLYQPKKTHVLSVVNDFANRDVFCGFHLWNQIVQGLPHKLLGDNPGISKPASPKELISAYRECKVFLNTSQISPVPTVLLEAMACGCAVVSTDTCAIPSILIDGYNGFICGNQRELRNRVEQLLEDEELGRMLGQRARETICSKHSMHSFIENWQRVFNLAKDIVYEGQPAPR